MRDDVVGWKIVVLCEGCARCCASCARYDG
jgi:hypothetical protein